MLNLYFKHHVNKEYTLIGLFRQIQLEFTVDRVIYPGCYVHITPSLIFPDVVYIDSFRNVDKFFASSDVKEFIDKNKEYDEYSKIRFYHQDYNKDIQEELESFDVIMVPQQNLWVSSYSGKLPNW